MVSTVPCANPPDLLWRTGVRQRLARYKEVAKEGEKRVEQHRARITSLAPKGR